VEELSVVLQSGKGLSQGRNTEDYLVEAEIKGIENRVKSEYDDKEETGG
jgi:hypothetical protein